MATWRLVTHHGNKESRKSALETYRSGEFIALGWGLIGDLQAWLPPDKDAIRIAIQKIPNFATHQSAGQGGRCLWGFYQEMQPKDLVILSIGQGPLRDVVIVTGDYEWRDTPVLRDDDYHNRRNVMWVSGQDGREIWEEHGGRPAEGWNRMWPLMRLQETL